MTSTAPVSGEPYTLLTNCRLCGSETLRTVLDLGTQALTGVFPADPQQPLSQGPVTLALCGECALLQLGATYNLAEMYGETYGYRSGLNRSMVRHLEQKVAGVLELIELNANDVVLDIGSNDATLLRSYPDRGQRLIGIDPSAGKFRSFYPSNIALVTDFFSAKRFREIFPNDDAKIVTSVAMFYDLERPLDFAHDVASILRQDGVWHFEQSYMPAMLQANAYDTACQEHLEYYGLTQVKRITDAASLKIIDVRFNDINGGSFAITAAPARAPYKEAHGVLDSVLRRERELGLDTTAPYEDFARRVAEHRDVLRRLVRGIRSEGKTIFGYGASTKGNVLLQYCGFTERDIPYIAEVNPDKFGCYTPGTGIPIISEAQARKLRPDYYLVLPWHFRDNILARERAFIDGGGKFIFPLPAIEVVP